LKIFGVKRLVQHRRNKGRYIVLGIDLVLIDQQSVGKISIHLMDTVNAKKRWTSIYGVSIIFELEPHSDPVC
jgi:hypothetical protein